MAITQMDGIQPRNQEEIFARNEEKLTQLGPVVERGTTEKLQPILDRVFGVLARRGMLPEAPEELQGQPLSIQFISTLAQAQRMIGLSQIERVVGFVGSLAAAYPEAADNLDPDEIVREYADRAGAPPRMFNGEDEIAEMRETRQAAQMEEKAAAMMPAVKQGADAARQLADAPVGGDKASILDGLVNSAE